MQRSTAGFVGGLVGGLIRLALAHIAFAVGISSGNTVDWLSRLFGTISGLWSWVIFGLAAGVIGLLVSLVVPKDYPSSYLTAGLLVGVVLWAGMNVVLQLSGLALPTWSTGANSFVVDLVTHLVWGISIMYGLWRTRVEERAS